MKGDVLLVAMERGALHQGLEFLKPSRGPDRVKIGVRGQFPAGGSRIKQESILDMVNDLLRVHSPALPREQGQHAGQVPMRERGGGVRPHGQAKEVGRGGE